MPVLVFWVSSSGASLRSLSLGTALMPPALKTRVVPRCAKRLCKIKHAAAVAVRGRGRPGREPRPVPCRPSPASPLDRRPSQAKHVFIYDFGDSFVSSAMPRQAVLKP